jgi:hypothetical protein
MTSLCQPDEAVGEKMGKGQESAVDQVPEANSQNAEQPCLRRVDMWCVVLFYAGRLTGRLFLSAAACGLACGLYRL